MSVRQAIHRMTVDEYIRTVHDLGWTSTELIEGVVYDVTPEFDRHAGTVMTVLHQLEDAFPHDVVRVVGSVQLSSTTIMDPDAYVIDGTFPRHPDRPIPIGAVKLVVEVSVTTQLHDGGPKLAAYAQAAVPEVWLIDPRPEAATLTRHRHPSGNGYRTIDTIAIGENASHLDATEVLSS